MNMIENIRFEIEKNRGKLRTLFSEVEKKKKSLEHRKIYSKQYREKWNAKNKRVYFYITPKEQKILQKRAKKQKMPLSNYIKYILFSDENKHQINTVFDTKKHQGNLVEVLKDLARIGNNINQIAKHLNRQTLAGKINNFPESTERHLKETLACIKHIQESYFE